MTRRNPLLLILLGIIATVTTNSYATTIVVEVSHRDDDAEEDDGGGMSRRNDKIEFGQMEWVGLRFRNVSVPAGATITSAFVRVKSEDDYSESTDLTIFGEDSDDTENFSNGRRNISDRSRTTASVTWSGIPSWEEDESYDTPDIASIIQEIVDRAGWTSGNDMCILVRSDDLDGKRIFWSYDELGGSSGTPALHITYSDGPVLTLADHGNGQESDAFSESGTETNAELFGFNLDPGSDSIVVTELALTLSEIAGIGDGDWAEVELVVDANGNGAIDAGESTTVGGSGVVSTSGGTITFSTNFTVSTATSYVLRADFASLSDGDAVTVALATSGITSADNVSGSTTSVSHAESCYTANFVTWTTSSTNSWNTQDLSSHVPADAVLEVAICNNNSSSERWGGVRTYGSSLDRRVELQEAESGGQDVFVMHVQADSSSRIECYAENTSEVEFVLLGYWSCGTYVETWTSFTAGADNNWESHNLNSYGISASAVVEVVAVNTKSSGERFAGIRTSGSSLDRRCELHEAEGNGVDAMSMFVSAGATADATIEVYAEDDGDITFYLAGYWSSAPGAYTEAFTDVGSPGSDSAWQDLDLSSWSVPAFAKVEIGLINTKDNSENYFGIRPNGSSLARILELHEAEGNGVDAARMHALADSNSTIEFYHEDVSDRHEFRLLGYWTEAAAPAASGLFADVSSDAGFNLQTTSAVATPSSIHWADFDNDGNIDALITGNSSSRVLTNSGSSTFSSSTFASGTASGQAAILDVDNDGDIDIWHHSGGLYENSGSGTFTSRGGVGFTDPTGSASTVACDVDQNGYADIVTFATNGNWIGRHSRKIAEALIGTTDLSYGLNGVGAYGDGGFASTADVDDDGDLDLFYHYGAGKLFLSDGDGTFTQTDAGISLATQDSEPVGGAWADYDNDGDMDLFVPRNASGNQGYLWRNDGGTTFTDVTTAAGITDTSGHRGCCWGDYDNDGDLDLYICSTASANVLYRNNGDGTFTSVNENADAGGGSQDAVFVDFDNDGDLDLAVTRQGTTNVLLENSTDNTSYLMVRVVGQGMLTNKPGLGVRVDLYDATGTTLLGRREVGTARGYGGSNPMWAHFGGVTNSTTYVVKVHFKSGISSTNVTPSTASTTIGSTTISQMVTIVERQPQLTVWQESDPTN